MLREGQVLRDRYEIVELIGEGGMARVYRGNDRRLSRPVVLKVLKDEFVDNAEFRERFAREASNAARLAHSHILKVYDVDEQDGVPFIVMEYYPAQDLKAVLKKVGRLSPARSVEIACDILDALDYAHGQGIVHRDLKPHNVLITDRNEVKITDFGIAKAIASDSLTRTGTMLGTASYISPEQAEGQAVGPQTDLYALGVMLYEMLSGRLPFEGDNAITVALKHVREAPPPFASRGASVPGALEDVVMTAMRKNPAERFRDAETFRRALKQASLGEGDARPSMPVYSLADSGEFRAAPPPPPPPVDPGPSGVRTALIWLLTLLCLGGLGYAAYIVWWPPPVRVPQVVGMAEDQARREVERLNLRFTVKDFVYSDEEPGIVKSQSPDAGTQMRRGSDVLVTISKGRQTVQVPSLDGMDREAARQALESRGLLVKWQEAFSDTVGVGRVAAQDPSSGTPVDLKTRVTVTISKGLQKMAVPKLAELSEKEARDKAEGAGFKLRTLTEKSSATVPRGSVMEQSPKAGTKVPKGTTIEVILSSGPETRSVPSLKTMTLGEAQNAARQQGFRLEVVDGDSSNPEARILDQDPLGGATAPQGAVIRVRLEPMPTPESVPEDVTVPGVKGMLEDAARAALADHGLAVRVVVEESDGPQGTVLRQSPDEGAQVKRGAVVELVVTGKKPEATPR
jgi:serine/threonine-protein kinase